jgi:RNA polymerase sigma-70 factor (ECF subfamily)
MQALESLPQEQHEALVLRYFSDMTVPEVAQALGWREGTVKSRLHRALRRLRKLLADDTYPEA